MALTNTPTVLESPSAAGPKPVRAAPLDMSLPELPPSAGPSGEDDSNRDSDEQKVSDYLTASLILQQYDGGIFGAMEQATGKLADATDKLGDTLEHGADKAADALENSKFVPKVLRDGAAHALRDAGSFANRGAHGVARGERQAMRGEHAVAQVVTGDYLFDLARHESGNNPFARPSISKKTGKRASSATGLYQFVDGTWLGVVAQHGKEHGGALAEAAQHIHHTGKGYQVDAGWKEKILDMRKDPQLSTAMAKDFTNDNAAAVQHIIGNRPLNNGDLYMAHFMGPQAAAKLIIGLDKNPNAPAADAFKDAARANLNIFYKNGNLAEPRSFAEVYALQTKDFVPNHAADTQLASASPSHANHGTLKNKDVVVASNTPPSGKKGHPGIMGFAPSLGPKPPSMDG